MKKIYTIDASNWLYRSYFAIQNITNLQGESTNALFGFIRTLNKLIKDFSPDYVVCVFDGPRGIEKRKKLYEGYKAKRQKMPADLRYQIEWAKEFCDLRGIAKLDVEGVEADDSMGSLAYQFANDETQVFLCTSDKDMAQLVNENVTILNTHKDNLLLDSNGVEKTYGVPPSQIIDYLAIVGDASDNIPGLPGFGSKTAISLLQKVGSLDALLNHPEVVPGKKKDVLIENTDLVKTSKQLVTIETDVQIPQDLEFYRLSKPDTEGLREFFIEKHFNSFLKELEDPIAQEPVNYQIVDSPEKLKELVKLLSKQKEICFDTETAPSDLIHSELVGIAFATSPKCAWYLPIENDVPVEVKDLFENPDINFFGHNVKQDCHTLWKAGIDVKNISFDIIIASYLLNSHLKQHSLDQLCLIYFGKIKTTIESVLGKGKQQKTMRSASVQSVSAFCAENVDYCWRLKEVL
ncbi:MAG: 5'-3' exonuclease H3TH domain-containing protein, partial [Waddliaceae bacterium]